MMLLIGLLVGMLSAWWNWRRILFFPAAARGHDQHKAQGTSLGALLCRWACLLFRVLSQGNADLSVALLWASGCLVAATSCCGAPTHS